MATIGMRRMTRATWSDALRIAGRLYSNRWFMGALMVVGLIIYLWGANHSLDYPEYDESAYYVRGYYLLHGDMAAADITNPGTSPLYVVYYALWYLLLRTPLVYPWVYPSCLFLMGVSGYLLLSRLFHPTLAWLLALAAVIGAAPTVPWNANYYFGAAILWFALSLLSHRVWMRALAAFVVLLGVYVRPDYLLCLFLLLALLGVYEWREARRRRISWKSLAASYGPVLAALLATLYLFASTPAADAGRVNSAIPWSYNDYYATVYPQQFNGLNSYADPWLIFEKDFGPIKEPRTVGEIVLAMLRRPVPLSHYLAFEAKGLGGSFVASATQAYRWRYQAWEPRFINVVSMWQVLWVAIALLAFSVATGVCLLWLRRERRLGDIRVTFTSLSVIALIALTPQIVALLLINPYQRYFMIFPLILAPLGAGLAVIAARFAWSSWSLTVPILLTLALVPHPFASPSNHPDGKIIAFIQAHVPQGSTIVGAPLVTYENYLSTEGYVYHVMEAPGYQDSVLVNAAEADPSLRYVLLTRSYTQATYQQWFDDWNRMFPDLHWTQVAQMSDPQVQLYALPRHAGIAHEISYVTFVTRATTLRQDVSTLPPQSAMDFSSNVTWTSDVPANDLNPITQEAWGVSAGSLAMHPYYQGMDPRLATSVRTTLPASWSGHKLVFLATLPPWSEPYPAKGVNLTFSVNQGGFTKSFEVFNFAQRNWVPIVLTLPRYHGAATLSVNITPRESVNYCTTWLSFIGVTNQ